VSALTVLTILLAPQLIAGVLASRERHVLRPAARPAVIARQPADARAR
jgi:hypothetical protein